MLVVMLFAFFNKSLCTWRFLQKLCKRVSANGTLKQPYALQRLAKHAESTRSLHPRLSQEALESCQTRVSKLELQQQHQQQTVQLESHDARVLLGKSINIMLAIITVILVCVSTAAKFAAPLMKSRHHVFATVLGLCFLTIFWKNWERLQHTIDTLLVPA